jgi:hypothetical protein
MSQVATAEPKAERNLDGYGAPPIAWSRVRSRLDQGFTQAPKTGGPSRHTCWLTTVNADGSPHVMPLGVLWVDGAFYFNTGPATRKGQNLARDPRCTLAVATEPFDLVVEGDAVRVSDAATLQRIADAFARVGWQATVRDGALYAEYSAPAAGRPPWHVYVVRPATIYALGTDEPYGATRFRF